MWHKTIRKESNTVGDLNTIVRGFLGGGVTNLKRKRYFRAMLTVAKAPPLTKWWI